jgi:hypothetical protein
MWGIIIIIFNLIYPNISKSLYPRSLPYKSIHLPTYNQHNYSHTMAEGTPRKEKKEKKDKKRKSEAADLSTETPVKPEAVAPAEGTASAEAVAMEVDGEKAAKKAKKEKRKSVAGEAAAVEEQDAKVSSDSGRNEIISLECPACRQSVRPCRDHSLRRTPTNHNLESVQSVRTILIPSPNSLSP